MGLGAGSRSPAKLTVPRARCLHRYWAEAVTVESRAVHIVVRPGRVDELPQVQRLNHAAFAIDAVHDPYLTMTWPFDAGTSRGFRSYAHDLLLDLRGTQAKRAGE